jgi:hypothetical protein
MRFMGMLWGSVASELHGAGLPDLHLHRHAGIFEWVALAVKWCASQSVPRDSGTSCAGCEKVVMFNAQYRTVNYCVLLV